MRNLFVAGGVISGLVLIVFGAACIAMGISARDEIRSNLAKEQIVGTPDMKGIAGKKVNTGERARTFAKGMRKHALEATDGRVYAEMGRFLDENGEETSDEAEAAKDPETGQPVPNKARDLWVTYTALSTALNMSYFGEQIATFAEVVGTAFLLTGIGFLVLVMGAVRGGVPARGSES